MNYKSAKFIISLLCGGPSLERGISLNSARSVMDHLQSPEVTIQPIYFDQKRQAYLLSPAQLYSNTPADFDFKLPQTAETLTEADLERRLKATDITFPVMHGSFGEDGTIQRWLEERDIPFVGSPSAACKLAFDKFTANEYIRSQGFYALPSCLLKIFQTDENQRLVEEFFVQHQLKRAIVKPAAGGSSIGVFSVSNATEALEKAELIFSKRMDTRVVIEPFVSGREFTVIILESRFGLPVAILPTEIETDYTEHQLFDFRRKYLPTRQVTYHCPPRFDDELIERIQLQSEQLFVLFGMRDYARFDGWVMDDGTIWFSDFNPVSGMEQNSFLFQQAARVGLSHRDVLSYIVQRSCSRQHLRHQFTPSSRQTESDREPLAIFMGGATSERQVSLMSGTNVWLKLRHSHKFQPIPYLLDADGGCWRVPYQLLLNHTVEEIAANCRSAALHEQRIGRFERNARERLGITTPPDKEEFGTPAYFSLDHVLSQHQHVFLALHGGIGEDGTLQQILEERGIRFNGSGSVASRLCMNKQATAEAVAKLGLAKVRAIPGQLFRLDDLETDPDSTELLWQKLTKTLRGKSLIVKPAEDGCSSGVARLVNAQDLRTYLTLLKSGAGSIPAGTFAGQLQPIELPLHLPELVRFEKYIETDIVRVKSGKLKHLSRSGYVELTIGVIEQTDGWHAFQPSLTIADGDVLSVEEKFQGGTGVNLTPPPPSIVSTRARQQIQRQTQELATRLGLKGYARIDLFAHGRTGEMLVIEVNTLPGLTASTVIFQQALAEKPAIFPLDFLERLADTT